MGYPQSEREHLSTQLLIINCPNCHNDTSTGFTLWDVKVLQEYPKESIDFDCHFCHHQIKYNPSTQEATTIGLRIVSTDIHTSVENNGSGE